MSLSNLFGKSPIKTLDDLICGDTPVTMANLLELDELQSRPEIVAAAVKLLQDPKHCHDGYDILGPLAAEGDIEAQFIMGDFCESVLNQPEKAAIWFQRAADQGSAKAQRNYADMLMVGKGVACDPKQAFLWYTKAAEQGVVEAQFVLGEFYQSGADIPKDMDKAIHWYELAKKNGFEPADMRLRQIREGQPYMNEDNNGLTDVDKTILTLPEDVIRSAEEGVDYYAGRNGIRRDFQKAFSLLLYAAQKGHTSAQYGLAGMYFNGQGTNQDIKQAIHWYSEAAKGGMGAAQSELAKILYNGVGCTQDLEKAVYWLNKAADNDIPEAMFTYGAMLSQGVGVVKDQRRGLEYVKMAARKGYAQAQSELKQLGIQY